MSPRGRDVPSRLSWRVTRRSVDQWLHQVNIRFEDTAVISHVEGEPVIKTEALYGFGDWLRGRVRPEVTVRVLITRGGRRYKWIKLRACADPEWRASLQDSHEALRTYAGRPGVPRLVHADEEQIVVSWVEGKRLMKRDLGPATASDLGLFVGRNLLFPAADRTADFAAKGRKALFGLLAHRLLSPNDADLIWRIIEVRASRLAPQPVMIGFVDAALKNFIRTEDGQLHYIDVLGIATVSPPMLVAKYLLHCPKTSQVAFRTGFAIESGIEVSDEDIAIHQFVHLLLKADAKQRKSGHLIRRALKRHQGLASRDRLMEAARQFT